jgi:hypothetical protein
MDAFYANVEIKDNPELKDKPMAVGSESMLVYMLYLFIAFVFEYASLTLELQSDLLNLNPLYLFDFCKIHEIRLDICPHFDNAQHSDFSIFNA